MSPRMYEDRMRRAAGVAKILVIVFVIFAVICGGYVLYIGKTWKTRLAQGIRDGLVPQIRTTALSDGQKDGLTKTLNDLADNLDAGKVSLGQLDEIVDAMSDGHFKSLILVEIVKARHIAQVVLDDDKRAEVNLLFDRLERGVADKTISEEKLATVMAQVGETDEDKAVDLKEEMTVEELTAFVEEMAKVVNDANIQEEPFSYDFAGELAKIVDKVLGTAPSETQPSASAPAAGATQPG